MIRHRAWAFASVVLLAANADAALLPRVSEQLTGRAVPDFQAEGLDGRAVSLGELRGKPLVVNFFASWCPVCRMEIVHLRDLQRDLGQRGISTLGILVDPVETPDTVGEARQSLARDPLPYPVLLMTPAIRDAFQYDGFPATYFIAADGVFSTTLLGYQPKERIEELAARIGVHMGTPPSPGPATNPAPGGTAPHHEWEKNPLRALLPGRWQEWHPMVVHFPIVLLVLEAGALALYWMLRTEAARRSSRWLLWLAVLALVPSLYTGIIDDGASLGPGSAFWNGAHDRLSHFLRLESSISVHVLFVTAVGSLALLRVAWRGVSGDRVLEGRQRFAFGAVTAAGLWLLFAAAQVGGGISHP